MTVTGGGGASAKVGETVSVTTLPDSGYKAHGIYTVPAVETRMVSENEFTFVMPDSDVVVGAEFKDESLPVPTPDPTSAPTAAPTPEVKPTASPEASAAPTSTPEPAATAEPTETPAPHDYLYEINGYEFSADGRINIDLTYHGGGTDRAKLIIASYTDGGALRGAEMYDIIGGDVSGVDYSGPADNIKIFIWDLDTLEPLAESR